MSKLMEIFKAERKKLEESDVSVMFHKEQNSLTYMDAGYVLRVSLGDNLLPVEMTKKVNGVRETVWHKNGIDKTNELPKEFEEIANRWKQERELKKKKEKTYER